MEVENNVGLSKRRQMLQSKYLTRLLPVIQRQGLSRLRIDDIVDGMGISKATFYKYFSSKEEVIEQGVDMVLGTFERAAKVFGDDSSSFLLGFQNVFAQSLFIASYLPDAFLFDLQQNYPFLWEHVAQAQQEREQRLEQFYEQGVAQGIFYPVRPMLISLQHSVLLRTLMNSTLLMKHDLTLKTALCDYYDMLKFQCLPPEQIQQMDDVPVRAFIDKMVQKMVLF